MTTPDDGSDGFPRRPDAVIDALAVTAVLLLLTGTMLLSVMGWVSAGRVGLLAVLGSACVVSGYLLLTGGDDSGT